MSLGAFGFVHRELYRGGNSVSAGDEVLSWSMKRGKQGEKGEKEGGKRKALRQGWGVREKRFITALRQVT